jgi:hypothetical protein
MKEHKRLTTYECGDIIVNCKACEYDEEHNILCTDYHCIDALKTRLCELEDMIENETLVELPCKVGDIVYFVSKKNGIQWSTINEIKIHYGFRSLLYSIQVRDDDYKWRTVNNKTVFLTKAEAEAKLK